MQPLNVLDHFIVLHQVQRFRLDAVSMNPSWMAGPTFLNAAFLGKYASELNSRELSAYQAITVRQAVDLTRDGNRYRKQARSLQGKIEGGRSYDVKPQPKR